MREIKFRGKLISDDFRTKYINGWIYGDYLKNDVSHFIITGFNERHDNSGYPSIDINFWQKVVSNTVGQFTGLYDKNAKEIYEGDIIRFYNDMDNLKLAGVVKFGNGAFYIDCDWYSGYRLMDYDMEILGNIHDNPELLEKENE